MQPLPLASCGGQNKILLPGSLLDSRDPCLQIGLNVLFFFVSWHFLLLILRCYLSFRFVSVNFDSLVMVAKEPPYLLCIRGDSGSPRNVARPSFRKYVRTLRRYECPIFLF